MTCSKSFFVTSEFPFSSVPVSLYIIKLQALGISKTQHTKRRNDGADSSAFSLENVPLSLVAVYQ